MMYHEPDAEPPLVRDRQPVRAVLGVDALPVLFERPLPLTVGTKGRHAGQGLEKWL